MRSFKSCRDATCSFTEKWISSWIFFEIFSGYFNKLLEAGEDPGTQPHIQYLISNTSFCERGRQRKRKQKFLDERVWIMKLCVKDSLRIFEDFKNTETTIERCSRVVVLQKTVMQFSSSILVIKLFDHF